MFDIHTGSSGEIVLVGRLDTTQVDTFRAVFDSVSGSRVVDFSGLQYIASGGLGVLIATQKRLARQGDALRLVNLNASIRDLFRFAGFDRLFVIA
jgi:anti-anti-sigma factor